ncbi:uncharacterized protein M6B38_168670 [Iris pallida]|uniref:Integrase catalytic domain-containing protein n=1 Tax=Iris pallida TaxID=29817 RepID=A0AAX6EVU2_IRIPA|nr:uncharacterized protein M6B38_168670 [Iris pallida]
MITHIRSDHGDEFENAEFKQFCDTHGYLHEFFCPRTPQQNRVVERKNRTLSEMARVMLNQFSLPRYLWAEAVNTACYILNRVLIRPISKKTPYELWFDRTPNAPYFKIFGCKCFILNTKDSLSKFNEKADKGIFLGYAAKSKGYRIFNKRTMIIEESINVKFDELNQHLDDDDNEDIIAPSTATAKPSHKDAEPSHHASDEPPSKEAGTST